LLSDGLGDSETLALGVGDGLALWVDEGLTDGLGLSETLALGVMEMLGLGV